MSTVSPTRPDGAGASQLTELWRRHSALYTKALEISPGTLRPEALEELCSQIEQLLQEIAEFARNTDSFEEYRWAEGTMAAWQSVYSTALNRPMRARMPEPVNPLVPRLAPIPDTGTAFTNAEFRHLIETIATTIASTRVSMTGRLSDPAQMEWDWRQAETFLVGNILDGKVNFAKRIGEELYETLERAWIKHVKCLWAYFNWVNRGRTCDGAGMLDDYMRACGHLQTLMINPRMKATLEEFAPVRAYIERRYLSSDGTIDRAKPGLLELIVRKADRIYGTTGDTNAVRNWLNAEAYVEMYYENIIPAVLSRDRERVLTVLKAFQFSKAPENGYRVINCFEVAIVIYFLDPVTIEGLWRESEAEPPPASHVWSSTTVAFWPRDFEVPEECQGRLAVNAGRIGFRGVMTAAQRDALLARVTEAEQISAIDNLFRQSRLIHRETTL